MNPVTARFYASYIHASLGKRQRGKAKDMAMHPTMALVLSLIGHTDFQFAKSIFRSSMTRPLSRCLAGKSDSLRGRYILHLARLRIACQQSSVAGACIGSLQANSCYKCVGVKT